VQRLLLATLLSLSWSAEAGVLSAWSQYGADGTVEARVITDAKSCPALLVDGHQEKMELRQKPSEAFPVSVCVGSIPFGAKQASAGGADLPVPVATPRHIVLLGDTGCRLKGKEVQGCNDENLWPFHRVAAHAAQEHPDLVIHVGDYLYRETPCPETMTACAGTPWGDNWPTWNADLFTPGADLLKSAVWLAERGNHEDCKRAGSGWTTLLGRAPAVKPCTRHEKPLHVDLGGIKVTVLDDNEANDGELKPDIVDPLRADVAEALAAKTDWIITHHPFRGVSRLSKKVNDGKTTEGANGTLQAALAGADESGMTLMLSGHIHNFQIENYGGTTPPQLVVGEGGDNLDTEVPPNLTGLISGGKTVENGLSLPGFGYVVIDRIGDSQDWDITVKSVEGAALRHCWLKSKKLACANS